MLAARAFAAILKTTIGLPPQGDLCRRDPQTFGAVPREVAPAAVIGMRRDRTGDDLLGSDQTDASAPRAFQIVRHALLLSGLGVYEISADAPNTCNRLQMCAARYRF